MSLVISLSGIMPPSSSSLRQSPALHHQPLDGWVRSFERAQVVKMRDDGMVVLSSMKRSKPSDRLPPRGGELILVTAWDDVIDLIVLVHQSAGILREHRSAGQLVRASINLPAELELRYLVTPVTAVHINRCARRAARIPRRHGGAHPGGVRAHRGFLVPAITRGRPMRVTIWPYSGRRGRTVLVHEVMSISS